jgi:hypothetical protein
MMRRRIKTLLLSAAIGTFGPACFNGCFVAGVRVRTPGGPRPIEDLEPGDEVWSWDATTRSLVVRRVMEVLRAKARTLCRLEIDGTSIAGVTPSHPFYRADTEAYVALRDLPPDTRLALLTEGAIRPVGISNVHITEHPEPRTPVFNLEVEGPEHNYFAEGILVHNKQPIPVPDVTGGQTGGPTVCDGWAYPADTHCGDSIGDGYTDPEVGSTPDGTWDTTPDEASDATPDGIVEPTPDGQGEGPEA